MIPEPSSRGATMAPRRIDAKALARALAELPVHIESVLCRFGGLALASYPDGPRPTSIVAISGRGATGYGENVAFTADEQRAFAHRASSLLTLKQEGTTVGHCIADDASPFERAALQSALVDLAMRQQKLSLRDLCGGGVVPRIAELRWVTSFDRLSHPAVHVRAARAASRALEFKIDVDPTWSNTAIAELERQAGVVTFDFKDAGDADLARRLSARFPGVIFEDPPAGSRHDLIARDRGLLTLADVEAAVGRGEIVNFKIPRLGGPIPTLEAIALAQKRNRSFYFGGMFEAGPGREQARQLAALLCSGAPNDLGPLQGAMSPPRPRSPSWVRLDNIGFGGTCAWSQLVPMSF
jgi:hypothetical protein